MPEKRWEIELIELGEVTINAVGANPSCIPPPPTARKARARAHARTHERTKVQGATRDGADELEISLEHRIEVGHRVRRRVAVAKGRLRPAGRHGADNHHGYVGVRENEGGEKKGV